jgi:hypothetical protein
MKLETSDTELRLLHEAAGRRGRAQTTTVNKLALRRLLADHHTLYSAATGPAMKGGKNHKAEVGRDQESLR